jgi:hypothetical protein
MGIEVHFFGFNLFFPIFDNDTLKPENVPGQYQPGEFI